MKYTQIPTDAFQKLQINAGILVRGATGFDPSTGTVTTANIMGATSGGVTASCVPTFSDRGEDVDNCPKNMKEFKKLDSWECKLGATFLSVDTTLVRDTLAAADIDTTDTTKIVPRVDLTDADFMDVWFVGDYSDKNSASNGGFIAIHLKNALSTAGFSLKTGDNSKGQFAAEFTGHVASDAQTDVPMEFFIKSGTAEAADFALTFTSAAGTETGKTAISSLSTTVATGETYVYQTGYNLRRPGAGDVLDGSAWAAWDGDDEISVTTGMLLIIAIIDGDKKAQHAGMVTAKAE